VLTGGAVVSIYTNNEYESGDLDFISPESTKRIAEVIAQLGSRGTVECFPTRGLHSSSSFLQAPSPSVMS
jgi:hypothetical protein